MPVQVSPQPTQPAVCIYTFADWANTDVAWLLSAIATADDYDSCFLSDLLHEDSPR